MSRQMMVSNRLPFKLHSDGSFAPSAGGLVTAIGGIRSKSKMERVWVGGAPEGLTEEAWKERPSVDCDGAWSHIPVFTDPSLYDLFYNGFCNDVLWPLLHYQNDLVRFTERTWNAYVRINEAFAEAILSEARPDDLIWIHDYHFFLLPELLKRERPDLRVGFFLHVPFPSSEVFRQLPVREQILESLLSADLVGFHDYAYLHHFCSSVQRMLGVDCGMLKIKHRNRATQLGVFPVSIDTQAFRAKARSEDVVALERRFRRPGFQLLGVDRLDYIKGIDLKFLSFRNLLTRYPEVRGKVTLLQVAVPTREGSPEFERLHQETNRLVGEINGQFSTPDWTPIQYMHSSVSHTDLIALYKASDALLVTSKRDGMNLVALEYIAAQTPDHPGVVLLSEFTGAISTLSYTIPINPWNLDDTADKMKLAMEMPKHEKVFRLEAMAGYLERYTATDWAQSFLHELEQVPARDASAPKKVSPSPQIVTELAAEIASKSTSGRVTLFLDYDGTLVPIRSTPEQATLPNETRLFLETLSRYPWLETVIISGRDSKFLQKEVGSFGFALGAEHGALFFDPVSGKWQKRVLQPKSSWYSSALKIISDYTARVPGSRVEKKNYSLAWHYRQAPQEHAAYMARKLAEELEIGLANLPVTVVRGHKVIEARSSDADKGVLARWYLETRAPGSAAIAVGDDRTDEDMFRALKDRGTHFRVGAADTSASYIIDSQARVAPLLEALLGRLDALFEARAKEKPADAPDEARPAELAVEDTVTP